MTGIRPDFDVIVDFWEYRRREERRLNSFQSYALDKCVEAYERSEWNGFDYWFAIYRRERRQTQNSDAVTVHESAGRATVVDVDRLAADCERSKVPS